MASTLDHCKGLPERVFEAGEIVVTEGRRGALYVLRGGAVEVVKGDVQVNVIDEPGAIFGEISALLGGAPSATVRTLVRSQFYVAEDGLGFLSSNTEVALVVARMLARRLHAVTGYLADMKRQFGDRDDHFGMVDQVLETISTDSATAAEVEPGSEREREPN